MAVVVAGLTVIQVQPDGSSAHLSLLACVALAALVVVPALEHARSVAREHDAVVTG